MGIKLLLLPDRCDNWSAHNRCLALQKYLSKDKYEIGITGAEPSQFKRLKFEEWMEYYDIVHIQFSSHAGHLYEPVASHKKTDAKVRFITTIIGHRLYGGAPDEKKTAQAEDAIKMFEISHATVSLSPELAVKYDGVKAIYIPNGVDQDLFKENKNPVIGHVGPRFTQARGDYKGGDMVAEACKQLGLEFSMPGCYNPFKIDRGPHIPPQRPHEDMMKWYKTIDVLVQPSVGEGCSNPIMEALYLNIPVFATVEAVISPLRPYISKFVSRGDTWEEGVANIKQALIPYATRRNVINNGYLWPQIVEKYDQLYTKIMELPYDQRLETL